LAIYLFISYLFNVSKRTARERV